MSSYHVDWYWLRVVTVTTTVPSLRLVGSLHAFLTSLVFSHILVPASNGSVHLIVHVVPLTVASSHVGACGFSVGDTNTGAGCSSSIHSIARNVNWSLVSALKDKSTPNGLVKPCHNVILNGVAQFINLTTYSSQSINSAGLVNVKSADG